MKYKNVINCNTLSNYYLLLCGKTVVCDTNSKKPALINNKYNNQEIIGYFLSLT